MWEKEVEASPCDSVHSQNQRGGGRVVVGSNWVQSKGWCVLSGRGIQFNELLVYLDKDRGTRKGCSQKNMSV